MVLIPSRWSGTFRMTECLLCFLCAIHGPGSTPRIVRSAVMYHRHANRVTLNLRRRTSYACLALRTNSRAKTWIGLHFKPIVETDLHASKWWFYYQIDTAGDKVRAVIATGKSTVTVVKLDGYIAPLLSMPALVAMIKLGSRRCSMRWDMKTTDILHACINDIQSRWALNDVHNCENRSSIFFDWLTTRSERKVRETYKRDKLTGANWQRGWIKVTVSRMVEKAKTPYQ